MSESTEMNCPLCSYVNTFIKEQSFWCQRNFQTLCLDCTKSVEKHTEEKPTNVVSTLPFNTSGRDAFHASKKEGIYWSQKCLLCLKKVWHAYETLFESDKDDFLSNLCDYCTTNVRCCFYNTRCYAMEESLKLIVPNDWKNGHDCAKCDGCRNYSITNDDQ